MKPTGIYALTTIEHNMNIYQLNRWLWKEGAFMFSVRRDGPFLEILDEEGCRHYLRLTSIQILSDTDPLQNETVITAAGRTLRVPKALDQIAQMVFDGAPHRKRH